MLKLVIWDMDGVIIDSEPVHNKISLAAYANHGIYLNDEQAMGLIGKSNKDIWTDFKNRYGLEKTVEELTKEELIENMKYYNKNDAEAIKGVEKLLKALKSKGIKLVLASSSPMKFIDLVINKLSLKNYFDLVLSGEKFTRSKPDPEIFLKALEYFEVSPSESVVIEDSTNGVKAAKTANINCVGYINKNSGNQDLSLADIRIDDFEKLSIKSLEELCK